MVNCIKTGMPLQNKMFEFERYNQTFTLITHILLLCSHVQFCHDYYDCASSRVHGAEDSQEAVFQEVQPLLTSLMDG